MVITLRVELGCLEEFKGFWEMFGEAHQMAMCISGYCK